MNDHKIVIRKGIKSDLHQVYSMLMKLNTYVGIESASLPQDQFNQDSGLMNENDEKFFHFLVAQDTKTSNLVGYILYYFIYKANEGKLIHIENLFTEENVRKCRVGSKLLYRVAKEGKQLNSIGMNVNVSNHLMIIYYLN